MGRFTSISASRHITQKALFGLFWVFYAISGIQPEDRIVWLFQGLVPLSLAVLLFMMRKRYSPSLLTTWLLFVQCVLLLLGAHYSYHLIPFMRVTLADGTSRSLADWVVHFVDGMVIATVMADLRDNTGISHQCLQLYKRSFSAIVLLSCLSVSILWEIIEWMALKISHNHFFLDGGIAWDTWIDVGMALSGSLLFLFVFSRRLRHRA